MAVTSHPEPSYNPSRQSTDSIRTSSLSSHRTSISSSTAATSPTVGRTSEPTRTRSNTSHPNHITTRELEHDEDSHLPSSPTVTSQHQSRRHEHDGEGIEELEKEMRDVSLSQAEQETKLRKRDYAVDISRIMGRQLVAAMNGGRMSSRSRREEELD